MEKDRHAQEVYLLDLGLKVLETYHKNRRISRTFLLKHFRIKSAMRLICKNSWMSSSSFGCRAVDHKYLFKHRKHLDTML